MQTEDIKKWWKKSKISEICEEIVDCLNRTAPISECKTGYKMIRTSNIKKWYINVEDVNHVSESTFKIWTRRSVPKKWDILLTREAPLWEVGLIKGNDQIFLWQRIVSYRIDPNLANNLFVYYSLLAPDLQWQIRAFWMWSTVEHMRVPDSKELIVNLPPLETQQKIASILSKYDDLIENNTKRIKILEQTAQEVYKEWFVKFKFPGHESITMVESGTDFWMIPEWWEVKKLWETVLIKKGKNITKDTITIWDIPVVAWGLSPAYYHNIANTISPVITISASGANAWFVRLYQENIWASDCSYLDKNLTDFIYFYYLFFQNKQEEVTRLQRWSAQPHVYPVDLMNLFILMPSDLILQSFEELISSFFLEISTLTLQNINLKQTRDIILPRLISGEVDVENLDIKF